LFFQQIADTHSSSYKVVELKKGNELAIKSLGFSWRKRLKDGEYMITDRQTEGKKRQIART
jgi:hypothetical protein